MTHPRIPLLRETCAVKVIEYHLFFANDQNVFVDSGGEADELVAKATPDLLPADLWQLDSPNRTGAAKLVKTYWV